MRTPAPVFAALSFTLLCCAGCPPGEGEGEGEGEEEPRVFDDIDISFVVTPEGSGGRNATIFVPDSYDGKTAQPLVLLLHGYGFTGAQMAQFTAFDAIAEANNFLYASPDGTIDSDGSPFWNAAPACCDFGRTGVDDSAFLRGIIDEARDRANIDPARIWVVGHSNGGFMTHRLACDHADVITAAVSMAGAVDVAGCSPSRPVALLQVHGTADPTIAYTGGNVGGGAFPGAEATVAAWSTKNGCEGTAVVDAVNIDLATDLAGAETTVSRHPNCEAGGAAELWSVAGGVHIINGGSAFITRMITFLNEHAR